ncbi:DUF1080 domain-containing protein [Aliiglaciecola sp. 3_MG-2023]|uniref:3-keto-disaccharide hydrolase n=1 Tax=Aliiglaciecola sp. 3_MG-2023 TaxID=3062644 RepID=UPI0026E30599|nr:DUF1080 domain-containing protein [Aliiglaciecola sp. 3_MG-2023]MDO6693284.1 DUF1080 domain-containing protein [Aliiglaciecola sp. 3_MG-2023]
MKSLFTIGLGLILLASCASTSQPKTENLLDPELSKFTNIYDYGSARMVDEMLELSSTANWFYVTKKTYKDFILEGEILMPDVKEYSNSGFMFRGQAKPKGSGFEAEGLQAEVDPSKRKWSGGIFHQAGRKWLHPVHPTRSELDDDFKHNYLSEWTEEMANAYKHLQWNKYRIEAIGSDIKVFVNGVMTAHISDTKHSEGFIGLQHHGSKKLVESGDTDNLVYFRNLMITEL